MRVRVMTLLFAGLLMLASCSMTTGSGKVKSESRPVSGFSKIDLSGSGDVSIEQSGTESLTIEAEDNILPNLISDVSDGTLVLGTKPNVDVKPTKPIVYRLTVKDLSGLSISGSGTVTASKISTPRLLADISGSGTITIGGSTSEQQLSISGSGHYRADDLASKSVTADISGSGDASVMVSGSLKVDISGGGTLTYLGDPQITEDISGSGDLIKG